MKSIRCISSYHVTSLGLISGNAFESGGHRTLSVQVQVRILHHVPYEPFQELISIHTIVLLGVKCGSRIQRLLLLTWSHIGLLERLGLTVIGTSDSLTDFI